MKARILVIDDEESIRFTFESFLVDEGHTVATARDCAEAVSMIDESDFDLVFADIILEDGSGIDVLRELRRRNLTCPVVMITGVPNVETASEAVRLGAFDYIPKPVRQEKLLHVTDMALRHKALNDEKEKYRSNLEAIFRSVRDTIITVDKDLHIVEINDAAAGMCGFYREDVIGKPFSSVTQGCGGRCAEALRETMRRNEPIEAYRMECHRHNRPRRLVTVNTFPLVSRHGVFSGAVMVLRDETLLSDLEEGLGERRQFHHMVGGSEKMRRVYSLIDALAGVQTTVLITGESGTGKELVAEALHYRGVRSHKPLVKVSCPALPESLLESELFGHVKGAFTGAVQDKIGRFQKADGGTIFLDEVGDLSPKVQLQLLRVLQEKEFERVGDSSPIRVDVRIVAATNKTLSERVRLGEFREDLYYRLKVVEVHLPPLRERREDVPLLVDHFIKKFNNKFSKPIVGVSRAVQQAFMDHPWPGNVRQLEHTLEHAFVLCHENVITMEDLPADFPGSFESGRLQKEDCNEGDDAQALLQALEKTGGNKAKAARILGIDRKTLYRKLERLNVTRDESEQ